MENFVGVLVRWAFAFFFILFVAGELSGCGEEEPEHCDTDECTMICIDEGEGDVGHCEFMSTGSSYCWCSWEADDYAGD